MYVGGPRRAPLAPHKRKNLMLGFVHTHAATCIHGGSGGRAHSVTAPPPAPPVGTKRYPHKQQQRWRGGWALSPPLSIHTSYITVGQCPHLSDDVVFQGAGRADDDQEGQERVADAFRKHVRIRAPLARHPLFTETLTSTPVGGVRVGGPVCRLVCGLMCVWVHRPREPGPVLLLHEF